MSKEQKKEEKIPTNCIECNYLKEGMKKFPCNHLICNECLCLLLIEQEFNHKKISPNISFYCPECLPNFKLIEQSPSISLPYSEIINIFSNTNKSPLKCIKHPKEDLKYFCADCNDELCEECKKADEEHDLSHIEVEDIKVDEAEKLIKNQSLTLDEIKNKIEENKKRISTEITQSTGKMESKIVEIIQVLNELLIEYAEKSKEKEQMMIDYFDMMIATYEKYYSMINSSQISLKTIKNISNMKNITNIDIFQNDTLSEKLDSLNSFITDHINSIKNIFPLKMEINFKDGLLQTGNCTTFTTEHKEFMTGGILINGGNNLVTTSTDNSLIIYEKKEENNKITFNTIKKEEDKKNIPTSLLSLIKDYFIVGYDDGLIKIWRTEDFEVDKIFTGHTAQINKIIKEADNSFISCSDDMTIREWELDSLEADSSYILTGHEDRINDILLINSNTTLISISDDKTLRIWSLELKECINAIKTENTLTCLGNLRNGKFMVGGDDGSITIFLIDGYNPIMAINAHSEPIEILYESPFTGDIISGSQDNLVKIFKEDNGTCVKILEGHKNTVLYVTQINENTIVTSSVDKTVKIWNL